VSTPAPTAETSEAQIRFAVIAKSAERHTVTGWAYIAKDKGGVVVDHSGDVIDIHELKKAMIGFMKTFRASGEMHRGQAPNPIVECFTFTPEDIAALAKDGMPSTFPQGTLVTVEIPPDTLAKIDAGSLLAFSIEGKMVPVPVEAES